MITQFYFHNLISSLPITYLFYFTIILKTPLLALGLCFSDGIVVIIKELSNYLPIDSWLYKITRRPTVGSMCDLLSHIPSKKNAPGFPSGHMAITLYFYSILIYLKFIEYNNDHSNKINILHFIKKNKYDIFMYMIMIILTGIARIRKGCHTLLQVIVGALCGVISSILFMYLHSKYIENIQ